MEHYGSAAAFRQALEKRLRSRAEETGVALQRLRTRIAMDRLLARLFLVGDEPWLLKGGYALELRLYPKARTTRDIDLTVLESLSWSALRDRLQVAAEARVDDGFTYLVGPLRKLLVGAPGGGARYPVEARVAGREFTRFHLDLGVGDPVTGEPEELVGQDFLGFAGVPPARVRAVPVEQMVAEKLHAYFLQREGRENTRVRDLVDLLLIADEILPSTERMRMAVERTFAARGMVEVPESLPGPPTAWRAEYETLAAELGIRAPNIEAAVERLRSVWSSIRAS